jgi:hypothetical protein
VSPETIPEPDSGGANVAAYALGALDPAEAEAFARHMETCAVCPEELAAFQQVVDDIAISAPSVQAPAKLRRRVMRAVHDEPRANPATEVRARPERRRRASLRGPSLALGGGIAFALAAIVVVIIALPGRQANRTVQAEVNGPGQASLQISGNHTELVLHHVTPPPHGKIYEVWLKHGSARARPTTALFSVGRDGDTSVDVPGSLYGVTRVLVTPEPPGGTRVPTHSPVITATL